MQEGKLYVTQQGQVMCHMQMVDHNVGLQGPVTPYRAQGLL